MFRGPLLAALFLASQASGQGFVHPGLLHRQADLDRMEAKVAAGAEPWLSGWKRLAANSHSAATYAARPVDTLYRGTGTPENYARLFNDAAAAYALALRWHVSGSAEHGEAALRILDAWSAQLKQISGTSDKYLAAGIYGYQLANAAELMRGHPGWAGADFRRFQEMLLAVFLPLNRDFLARHNGACISHYWANWDLVNMASLLAIGVLCDRRELFDEAVAYFKGGAGNGAVDKAIWFLHPGGLGQFQESGRDQGHSLLGIGMLGIICEMAWNQGVDLYGHDDNRVLKGAEYVARYNNGLDVPYAAYDNCDQVDQTAISPDGRGQARPIWALVYHHYSGRRSLAAPNCAARPRRIARPRRRRCGPRAGAGTTGPTAGASTRSATGPWPTPRIPGYRRCYGRCGRARPGAGSAASA
jgi:hypothetical protein